MTTRNFFIAIFCIVITGFIALNLKGDRPVVSENLEDSLAFETKTVQKIEKLTQKVEGIESENLARYESLMKQNEALLASFDGMIASLQELNKNQKLPKDKSLVSEDQKVVVARAQRKPDGTPNEIAIANWMEETLEEYVDAIATEQASAELSNVLHQSLPGTNINKMQCGDGFCRATLSSTNGQKLDVSSVWGSPPFVNEGFSVPGKDGQLYVYFTDKDTNMQSFHSKIALED